MKKIEALKANYIGQPFSKLLSEMPMTFVTFGPIMSNSSDVSQEPTTIFMFLNPTTAEDYRYPYMRIIWQTPLDFNASDAVARLSSPFGSWNSTAIAHYQNAIVENILIGGRGSNRPAPPGGWANWTGGWYAAGKKVIKTKSNGK
ncbi:hypothetical protein [Niabella hibiscisoli]|uniref:hypothetical protein n=1 Tax=Niabella hibiscisoli TaxID=1825928 RepID=UPI001F0D48FA|nr:hypothetical protein [Niabella hibiscisoli]MCH5716761.1 hypothetical protein [Niabella hibiscisoli]